ncbi:hypothetical protein Pmar_PMAR007363 [Perkinsus marinus ATCC 50983]|uniref:Uncharacterized protein n=1 Tax=Perkinsus marinus (strain ATCC 50983 / TXsc) TaxID=423536 RepID=C5K648_PERM5|nr:hypothetical protein Pmar_PMAR007363 [Perkinsus marinus ATCC 50983]EER20078.1 hypothetical protein Pmar_PMAR007363 [Perkinsus marinus ATCC 50983]|eukprot:XP_002788282.1 hypothetical protein Pmar_PMAR007363 [Perkinsus marinus ATCC 50983]
MAVAQTRETGRGRVGVSPSMHPYLFGVTPQELYGITDEVYGALNLPSTTTPGGSAQPTESGSDETTVVGNSSAVIDVEEGDTPTTETPASASSPVVSPKASNIWPTASASSSSRPGLTKPSTVKTRKDRPRASTKRELETLEELTLREELTLSRLRKRKLALQIAIYEAKLKKLGEPIPVSSSLADAVLDVLAA